MKICHLKSQTSAEYIIGLVGLFVLVFIVLAFIYDFPFFLSSSAKQDSENYWSLREVGILSAKSNGSTIYFSFINNVREPIQLDTITIENESYELMNMSIQPIEPGFSGIYIVEQSDFQGFVKVSYQYYITTFGINRSVSSSDNRVFIS